MNNNTFVLGSGQAHELEMGFRRTGWDNAEVKVLCTGNNLTLVKDLINGKLEFRYKKPPVEFPVWKTIKIGTHKSEERLWKALEDSDFKVDIPPAYSRDELSIAETETKIELVKISTGELGFKKSFGFHDFYVQAAKSGLYLLPAEVGPQLRLQYPDQPYGEELWVGMEVMDPDSSYPDVFVVYYDITGKGIADRSGGDWSANSFWLFGRRQY